MKVIKEFEKLFGPQESSEVPSFYVKQIMRSAWVGNMCTEMLRGLCWRLFLGIISPSDKSLWRKQLTQQVTDYEALKLKTLPSMDKVKADPLSAALASNEENQTDEWNAYYKNVELVAFIKGDLDRLFMSGIEDEFFQTTVRRHMLQNILNIWSLQHPNISYRQGMHEIAGICLFVVEIERIEFEKSKVAHEAYVRHPLHKLFCEGTVEAHSFWLFERVMAELHPLYDPLPTSTHGLENQPFVVQFSTKIQEHYLRLLDPELCEHLESSYVQSQLYGLRWARLLLTREFPVDDKHVLRLWDYMFVCCFDAESENPSAPVVDHRSAVVAPLGGAAAAGGTVVLKHKSLDEDMPPNIYSVLSNARLAGHTCLHNINNSSLQKIQPAGKKGRGVAYVVTPLLGVLGDFMLAMMLEIRDILMEADSNIVIGYLMRYPEVADVMPIIENADMIRRGVIIRDARLGASFLNAGVDDGGGGGGGAGGGGADTGTKRRVPEWLMHPTGGRVSGALRDAKESLGNQINKMTQRGQGGGAPPASTRSGDGSTPRKVGTNNNEQTTQQNTRKPVSSSSPAAPPTRRRANSQMDYVDEEEGVTVTTAGTETNGVAGVGEDNVLTSNSVSSTLELDPFGIASSMTMSTSSSTHNSSNTASKQPLPLATSAVTPSRAGFGVDYGGGMAKDLLLEATSGGGGGSAVKAKAGGNTSSSNSSSTLFGSGSSHHGGGVSSSLLFGGSNNRDRDRERRRIEIEDGGVPMETWQSSSRSSNNNNNQEDDKGLSSLKGKTSSASNLKHNSSTSSHSNIHEVDASILAADQLKIEGVHKRMLALADMLQILEHESASLSSTSSSSGVGSILGEVGAHLSALGAVLQSTSACSVSIDEITGSGGINATSVARRRQSVGGYSLRDYDHKLGVNTLNSLRGLINKLPPAQKHKQQQQPTSNTATHPGILAAVAPLSADVVSAPASAPISVAVAAAVPVSAPEGVLLVVAASAQNESSVGHVGEQHGVLPDTIATVSSLNDGNDNVIAKTPPALVPTELSFDGDKGDGAAGNEVNVSSSFLGSICNSNTNDGGSDDVHGGNNNGSSEEGVVRTVSSAATATAVDVIGW